MTSKRDPINSLDDAKKMCADMLAKMENGEEVDAKIWTGLKTFVDVEVARLKNDPDQEANLELARKTAAKVAEKIDIDTARQILLGRNFRALEDAAGIVDCEAQRIEGEKVAAETLKLINKGERAARKRR